MKHHNSNPMHLCSANSSLSVLICQQWVLKPRAAQRVHWWRIWGALSTGLPGYNTYSLTMNHSGYHAWRVSRSLQVKHLLCRFRKRVGASFPLQKTSFSSLFNFLVASNVVGPVHPSISYFYVVFIYCVVLVPVRNIAEILLAGQSTITNKSIMLSQHACKWYIIFL